MSANGRSIVLIGPRLLNLERELGLRFISKPTSALCDHKVHHRDRCDRIEVTAPADTIHLLVETSLGEIALTPQPSLEGVFRDKRVILTVSKNNDLRWIYDWALFHQRRHGCNAALIYDNGSTRYASNEIADALSIIDGLDEVVVIDWPFPWGPTDGIYDSKFCQLTMLEHARLRCLSGAKSVLQGDVDELVLAEDGESVFELAERSASGYLRYGGLWVEAVSGNEEDATAFETAPCHRYFYHVRCDADHVTESKWTSVPAMDAQDTQWLAHKIARANRDDGIEDRELASRISLRHFKAINTGWKVGRSAPEPFNPDFHRPGS